MVILALGIKMLSPGASGVSVNNNVTGHTDVQNTLICHQTTWSKHADQMSYVTYDMSHGRLYMGGESEKVK